ncbi:MAG: amidinotransferase [Dysgonamonadaceae bacterium]|jgi:hypothetical protein|nr:amidinotransferase [Dysgonamonadaceae bacterium]
MERQNTHILLMIEPVAFGFNEQTAENNYFQQRSDAPVSTIQAQALLEFQRMVNTLQQKDVEVVVVQDTLEPHTPDSIFPNNWISFHAGGTVVLYPMFAENRRAERRLDLLKLLENKGFTMQTLIDYTDAEKDNRFLEGTGSMILDRANRVAYAALSERTDRDLFLRFCRDLNFKPVYFHANQTVDRQRLPIYHTNVIMCVADRYAVVCLDSIDDPEERKQVVENLKDTNKEIISITEKQMHCFAGNMLQIENKSGEKLLVLSASAYQSLTDEQMKHLSAFNEIVPVALPAIEKYGGGSARCMMAEIFTNSLTQ